MHPVMQQAEPDTASPAWAYFTRAFRTLQTVDGDRCSRETLQSQIGSHVVQRLDIKIVHICIGVAHCPVGKSAPTGE